ncbi:GCN5 family N-acetyltransferase [Ligilactobacillus salitolerans]|uniref:GCN5 family N-acetyltransferase n=1 Tax=Ligilactobacillus salitolerans TaxID=1808352 RepID=A0A401IVH9_9LACO|nr:GNAT family N-acetyltransferase [Ligilactobacillus salitolerans]GBG95553.1 GCN5 family N-acetyltransferase [Ligilactobacillus salitolerans]
MLIRPLERKDLKKIHHINNQRDTMAYWFEEAYESFDELEELYAKHIHDTHERRFVIQENGEFAGVVELVDIDYIPRTCEIQVIVLSKFRGRKLAQQAMDKALEHAFFILNMHKVYLYVDTENKPAIHIYQKLGFQLEGTMKEQFYARGNYRDSHFMGIMKRDFVKQKNREMKDESSKLQGS